MIKITGDLNESINLNYADIIALLSVFIAIIALLVTIVFNLIQRKQYLNSLSPLLSFKLIEYERLLFLSITNTGKSFASDIKIDIQKLCNNGSRDELILDELFNNNFMLYPNETVQGMIGIYGESVVDKTFPFIKVQLEYVNGNNKKKVNYFRTITFTKAHEQKVLATVDMDTNIIEKSLENVARSNLRIANYLDGCQLAPFDELNLLVHRSLHDDINQIYGKKKRISKAEKK